MDDELLDSTLGSLPTLIVPDDPVNGAIEKPRTPPPVEIDVSRLPPAVAVHKPAAPLAAVPAVDGDDVVLPTPTTEAVAMPEMPLPLSTPAPQDRLNESEQVQSPPLEQSKVDDSMSVRDEANAAAPQAASVSSLRSPRAKSGDGDGIEIAMLPSEAEPTAAVPLVSSDPSVVAPAPDTPVIVASNETPAPIATPLPAPLAPAITTAAPVPQLSSKDYRTMAKRAQAVAKLDRLAAGSKSVFDADMNDIGALGIGMQLYFMLTKYLSVAFLLMGLVSLPTIVVNYFGHGVTDKLVDPLQLAYASLGNQGVSEDIASDPRLCLPKGDIDCNWTTVDTPFTTDPNTVSWIITIGDCVYSVVFLLFYLVFRYRAQQAIELHMTENLTPGKYAVFVRGLPPDATDVEILEHFNRLYDPTTEDEYFPLFLSCCWGRRRKMNKALQAATAKLVAANQTVVTNLDHLAGTTLSSANRAMYLNTWIAEVSVGHPTGGLLRTFLSMEALTKGIAETTQLVEILELEKKNSDPRSRKTAFKPADELLLQNAKTKLAKLHADLDKKTSKIKALKHASADAPSAKTASSLQKVDPGLGHAIVATTGDSGAKSAAALAKAARKAATATEKAFNWDACQCAFVVFNNLESRRRCLRDYRKSTWFFPRRYQPKLLRFRNGTFPLIVKPAPEPSNILWENLEITDRGRFYRRSLTNFVTCLLLLFSCAIISGAQSAQATFKAKMPPAGLCEWSLPQVFYGNDSFDTNSRIAWDLAWNPNATCAPGPKNETRYHIAYTNGILHPFVFNNTVPVKATETPPRRCTDPCIAETSSVECSTLPCFNQDLVDDGEVCETYLESHMLYCFCTDALSKSIADFGVFDGPQQLWTTYLPCRGFITDYLAKNAFIVLAAGVVVIVNLLLKAILRAFANFERHSSESAKASAIAIKMFSAQFLNTAVIVLIVNSAIGVSSVPIAKELFKGKFRDFERDWYPTVGMGITMTMLINAFVPQGVLFVQMFIVAPLVRCIKRRKIRTQEQMNKLYAGPTFDISVRYPMILNSVFVTMIFCGGSPVLLFIAAAAAGGTFWFDKLSIIHLYSIKTAYDEELGEIALGILPWTLVLHLAFSTWMYGNTKLMKSTQIDITATLGLFGYKPASNATDPNAVYQDFLAKASKIDVLGENGFMVKIVQSNVMTMFLCFVAAILGIFVSTLWLQVLLPILKRTLFIILRALWRILKPRLVRLSAKCCGCCARSRKTKSSSSKAAAVGKRSAKVAVDNTETTKVLPITPTVAPGSGEVSIAVASDDATPAAAVAGADDRSPESVIVPPNAPSEERATSDDTVPVPAPTPDTTASPGAAATADSSDSSLVTHTSLGTVELLVPKSAPPVPPIAGVTSDAGAASATTVPAPASTGQMLLPAQSPIASPRSARSTPRQQRVIPEFTEYFRKSVPRRYRPDTKLGFAKNDDGELVRKWQDETIINGVKRLSGEPMRTWEAMQAPVKIYAIEANTKYRLAVTELVAAASKRGGRTASASLSKVVPASGGDASPDHECETKAVDDTSKRIEQTQDDSSRLASAPTELVITDAVVASILATEPESSSIAGALPVETPALEAARIAPSPRGANEQIATTALGAEPPTVTSASDASAAAVNAAAPPPESVATASVAVDSNAQA